jgi:Ca2+-binding RTX toxin-like protein
MVNKMAKLTANIAIDPDDLDFEQFDEGTFSNNDATQDVTFQIQGDAGGIPITVTVTGEGFEYQNIPGIGEVPTTGFIDSISVGTFLGTAFSLTDISRDADDAGGAFKLSVEQVLAVASTDRTTDDLALIRKIFAGDDELRGSSGGDVLAAFGGSDLLIGGAGGDVLNGGAGNDTASYANADGPVTVNLANPLANAGHAQGDSLIDIENIVGGKKGDTFVGAANDDRFNGGLGKDTMDGGGGEDIFEFTGKLTKKNVDTINNFDSGDDTLFLSKTIFKDVNEDSVGIGKKTFALGTAATDADDRIIYDENSGKLWYDRDGSGGDFAKKLIAIVHSDDGLVRGDFELF